jgi:hypothetical protein
MDPPKKDGGSFSCPFGEIRLPFIMETVLPAYPILYAILFAVAVVLYSQLIKGTIA